MRVRAYFDGFDFYKGSVEVERLHHARTGSPLYWKWLDVHGLRTKSRRLVMPDTGAQICPLVST